MGFVKQVTLCVPQLVGLDTKTEDAASSLCLCQPAARHDGTSRQIGTGSHDTRITTGLAPALSFAFALVFALVFALAFSFLFALVFAFSFIFALAFSFLFALAFALAFILPFSFARLVARAALAASPVPQEGEVRVCMIWVNQCHLSNS